MNKQQIEQWAIEADQGHAGMDCLGFGGSIVSVSTLERFAALVAAHEREQCALEADRQMEDEPYGHAAFRCANIAHAIRERNNQESK